ncbi:MAG: nucleotidyl transferase AbiEii/AbiGii toxin family protein, partial [Anaerolineales bacterium]
MEPKEYFGNLIDFIREHVTQTIINEDLNSLMPNRQFQLEQLGFSVTLEFDKVLFFQLRYPSSPGKRNTLRVGASNIRVASNQYKVQYFPEIDRLINSQTIETMFANKLVAVMDRYAQHQTIAGRDIYDIHHFFVQGYAYDGAVIRERTGMEPKEYFGNLIDFIREHVTQTIINEDLNSLMPNRQFQ